MSGLRRIVVCSLEDWDDVWRRNQFLADRLLRRHPELRILFVEPPSDPLHDLSRRSRPRLPRLRVLDGDRRLKALRPLKPLPRRAGPLADAALHAQVRTAARLLGFERPVLWLNDVTYAPLIHQTGWPTVYDVTDDWLLAPVSERERNRLRRLDGLALRDAAEVVVCSPALADSRGAIRPVTLIPNAVDVEHFRRPRDRPQDLPSAPVAVYVGTLHESRLDVELVAELARALEPVAIALVGPDSLSAGSRSSLGTLPNVHLLGPRAYEDVPAYLQHADVIIVPHRRERLHREPRSDQGLRVPRGRPADRRHARRRLPRARPPGRGCGSRVLRGGGASGARRSRGDRSGVVAGGSRLGRTSAGVRGNTRTGEPVRLKPSLLLCRSQVAATIRVSGPQRG